MANHHNTILSWWRVTGLSVLTTTGLAMVIASGGSNDLVGNLPPTLSLTDQTLSLPEDTDTSAGLRVANVVINDDSKGTNDLSLSGANASLFEIINAEIRIKAGSVLDFETAPTLTVTVNVDDSSIGSSPDDSQTLIIAIVDVDEGSGPPDITFSPRLEMTSAERMAAIETIKAEIKAVLPAPGTPWEQRDLGTEVQTVAERLAALPEVVAVIYETELDKTATILMADGFPLRFFNSRPPHAPAQFTILDQFESKLKTAKFANLTANVPGSKTAVSASFDGGGEIATEIASRLGDAGYQVLNLGPSVQDMANYKNLGFLYIDSHGGSFVAVERVFDEFGNVVGVRFISDSSGNTTSIYVIETSTIVNTNDLADFDTLIDDGQLAMSVSENFLFGRDAHIGITEKFIQQNWSFDHGVAIMHTCYGGTSSFNHQFRCAGNGCPPAAISGTLTPVPIRQAIQSAGADVLMSFTNLTWPTVAAPSMYFFIDRLLGANVEQPPSPEIRPFDSAKVQAEMARLGLLQYFNGSNLNGVNIESASNPGLLAPSIKNMDLVDSDDTSGSLLPGQLTINGDFGTDQGTVELDGAALNIRSWTLAKIEADVPYEAPGAGAVIVKSQPGIESNPAPLTEWFGTITLTQTDDDPASTLESRAEINVRFRADLHKFRESVSGTPQERIVTNYISPLTEGTASGNGQKIETDSQGRTTTITYSGSSPMVIFGKTAVDNLGSGGASPATAGLAAPAGLGDGISEFAASIRLDPANNTAEMCMWILGFHDIVIEGPTGTFTQQTTVVIGGDLADRSKSVLACVDMTLNDSYMISSGNKTNSQSGVTRKLEWSQFNPVSPPDADTRS